MHLKSLYRALLWNKDPVKRGEIVEEQEREDAEEDNDHGSGWKTAVLAIEKIIK